MSDRATDAAVAVVCGIWAAVFLAGSWPALLTVPLVVLALLPLRRWPLIGAGAVLAAAVVQWGLGVPSDNPAAIAAELAVFYVLGRSASPAVVAPAALAYAAVAASRDGFTLPTAVFTLVLLGSVGGFGWSVRRRTERARTARRLAADLATRDPVVLAARLVAQERARLAGEVLGVIRGAVAAMQQHAARGLDPAGLAAIQSDGRRAITELRRLLGLLRDESAPPAAPPPAPVRRTWPVDALVAGVLAGVAVVENMVLRSPPSEAASVVLSVVLAATVAVRRVDPTVAALLAVLAPAVALGTGVPILTGVAGLVAAALVAWSLAERESLGSRLVLGLLVAMLGLAAYRFDPGNEALLVAVLAVVAIAGHLWAAGGRAERSAAAEARATRSLHAAVAERAVRDERLRLARELHDVSSHAVGVMVLQAGAAAALRERDPARAQVAVAEVRRAGVEAMSELDVLFGLLDAGAVGAAGLAGPGREESLRESITGLVGRMRGGGLHVAVSLGPELPVDPTLAATAHRIAQEALTNAARHAPGSRVELDVRIEGGHLEIEIRDDGPGAAVGEGGFGLVGLAERVTALGGELAAGPRPGGGFAVAARLPVRTAVP